MQNIFELIFSKIPLHYKKNKTRANFIKIIGIITSDNELKTMNY